jgi:Fungal specific transcription factor domain
VRTAKSLTKLTVQSTEIIHLPRFSELLKTSDSSDSSESASEPLARPVVQSVEDIAFHHLFMAYLPKSSFHFLSDCLDEFSTSKCFNTATHAVALANLARQRVDGSLMNFSRSFYVRAVREVNQALKSPEVSRNSTLAAASILGIFESLAMSIENSLNSSRYFESWVAHTSGTMSLIRFRGTDLLQTRFGKELYLQASIKFRINCCQEKIRIPSDFLELDKQMAPLTLDLSPNAQGWPLVDKFNEMFAREEGM